jgi:hypothetical protein
MDIAGGAYDSGSLGTAKLDNLLVNSYQEGAVNLEQVVGVAARYGTLAPADAIFYAIQMTDPNGVAPGVVINFLPNLGGCDDLGVSVDVIWPTGKRVIVDQSLPCVVFFLLISETYI